MTVGVGLRVRVERRQSPEYAAALAQLAVLPTLIQALTTGKARTAEMSVCIYVWLYLCRIERVNVASQINSNLG